MKGQHCRWETGVVSQDALHITVALNQIKLVMTNNPQSHYDLTQMLPNDVEVTSLPSDFPTHLTALR